MNYTQLSANIQAYTENTESNFVAEIPVFVQQAEQRIYNSVQFPSIRKNVTGVMSTGNKYLACPADFLAVYSMAVITDVTGSNLNTGTYEYLLNKDVNFIRQSYPVPDDKGVPKYYALFGPQSTNAAELSFIVGPTPDTNYNVELHYYFYPESIVTAGTTWLGDNFDSVLLYGAICEAYTYMKGEADMVKLAQDRYVQAIALLKNLGDGKQRADSYRDGQVRVAVS
jgi:hypothetical protein